jgi:hypothetical protein
LIKLFLKSKTVGAAVMAALIFCLGVSAFAQAQLSEIDSETLVIDDAPDMNVIAFGRDIHIRGRAKEVFSWGGDVLVEGRVEGDVAALGGSIIQKKDAYIGGSVIVIGGSYKPESDAPLRAAGKETVMFGIFEDEFREMAKNPSQIFAPSFTPAFAAQRALSALFWFIVTLVFATMAPGAVSRAIVRMNLSTLKVLGLGAGGFVLLTVFTVILLRVLPDYAGAIVGLMAFVLLMLAYIFGRVALQVSVGKALQKRFLPQGKHSESIAILIGVLFWTLLLSIPYIWTAAVFFLFSAGVGLVLTVRRRGSWSDLAQT